MKWELSGLASFYSYISPGSVTRKAIDELVAKGSSSPDGRARLCLHNAPSDQLHLMLIYHDQRTAVPIHSHSPFGEFLLLFSGSLRVALFDETRRLTSTVKLADDEESTRSYWIPPDVWHSIHFCEPTLFYEISQGPYDGKRTAVIREA